MARAIVLAAGFNERLDLNRPKSLLPLVGRTSVLDSVVGFLNVPEVRSLVIVHNGRWARDFRRWKASVTAAVSDGPLARLPYMRLVSTGIKRVEDRRGAVADLEQALYHVTDGDPIIVMPGDTVCEWSFLDFLSGIDRRRPTIALAEVTRREVEALGVAVIEPGGRLEAFGDPHTPLISDNVTAPPYFTTTDKFTAWLGPLWLPADARHHVGMYCEELRQRDELPDSLGRFVAWLVGRSEVHGWLAPGRAWDVGTREAYERARRSLSA